MANEVKEELIEEENKTLAILQELIGNVVEDEKNPERLLNEFMSKSWKGNNVYGTANTAVNLAILMELREIKGLLNKEEKPVEEKKIKPIGKSNKKDK